jgi:hypothetical protein
VRRERDGTQVRDALHTFEGVQTLGAGDRPQGHAAVFGTPWWTRRARYLPEGEGRGAEFLHACVSVAR